jgi:agmatine deiminase
MITDNQTNFVWFSALLKEKYSAEFGRIIEILTRHHINFDFLKETKDIWCRDYMPVQLSKKEFVQFRYEPSYLKTEKELLSRSDPKLVNEANGIHVENSLINLDGGNIVRYQNKAMITARVYKENRDTGLTEAEIRDQISKDLHAEVIIIPEHRGDEIDHADGYVRFLDDKTILVNELANEYKYWVKGMNQLRDRYGFKFVEIPWFTPKKKKNPLSALGIYINFLEVGNLILLPKFEIEGNRDEDALKKFIELYPGKTIEQVNINDIAEEGGLLNCISWNIKSPNNGLKTSK